MESGAVCGMPPVARCQRCERAFCAQHGWTVPASALCVTCSDRKNLAGACRRLRAAAIPSVGLFDQDGRTVGSGWLVGRARFVTHVNVGHGDLRTDRFAAEAVVADTHLDRGTVLPCTARATATATLLNLKIGLTYASTAPPRFYGWPVLTSGASLDGDGEWNRLADIIDTMTEGNG